MSVQEAYRLFRDESLLVNRRYQRKLVWTVEEKQLLIRSILDGYPIPLILLAERPDVHGHGRYEIIDGMQRLDALFSFIEQKYTYEEKYFDLDQHARARQAADQNKFEPAETGGSVMTAEDCASLLDYQLAVTIYPTSSEAEITEVFRRINASGRQLSAQEKRQAGVLTPFSELVRKVARDLRGDVSADVVRLQNMPGISVESARERQKYGVKAEETVWCRYGILNAKQLREGEDEQLIADIAASILFREPIAFSKELMDELYDERSPKNAMLIDRVLAYGQDTLEREIRSTFSIITEIVDRVDPSQNSLRNIVRKTGSHPIKGPFYAIFVSFFNLVIQQGKSPIEYHGIVNALQDVAEKLKSGRHYTASEDRMHNITHVTGRIQRYFVEKAPSALGHGSGLSIDFANSIRRSKVETARYEFKQGFLRLDEERTWDSNMAARLVETICAIANSEPGVDGYIYIGVCEKKESARKIEKLDGVKPIELHSRYVVGVDREASQKGWELENYLEKVISSIRKSDLSEPLKSQILPSVDTIDYSGFSVVQIKIPGQDKLSHVGDKFFIRHNSSTKQVSNVELLALSDRFGRARDSQ